MTYYEVIQTIRAAYTTENKSPCNTVSFGSEDEMDMDRTVVYPLCHIVPVPSTIQGPTVGLGFRVHVLDRRDWDDIDKREQDTPENRQDNLVDIIATSIQIHAIALGYLGRLTPNDFKIGDTSPLTPEVNGGKNELAGHVVDFVITVPNGDVTDGGIC